MGSINLILDLAGVLIWFYWRTMAHAQAAPSAGVSLLATLKRAEAARPTRGSPLFALAALLLVRTFFYWHIGPAVEWTPCLQLGPLALPLRSDFFDRILLFSLASFLMMLGRAYLWLLLLSSVGLKASENDPLFRSVRMQLGWIDRWPLWVKLLLPCFGGGILWLATNPVLVALEILPRPVSTFHLFQQAVVMGLGAYLVWRLPIIVLLLFHLVNNYVYLGAHPFWNSVNTAARNLLRPLAWLPLRMGSLDFTALGAIILVFFLGEAGDIGMQWFFARLPT
jgi:uncharacterized protein YggT (Ycf19 family)